MYQIRLGSQIRLISTSNEISEGQAIALKGNIKDIETNLK